MHSPMIVLSVVIFVYSHQAISKVQYPTFGKAMFVFAIRRNSDRE